jgi:hypothetical protein
MSPYNGELIGGIMNSIINIQRMTAIHQVMAPRFHIPPLHVDYYREICLHFRVLLEEYNGTNNTARS